MFSSNLCSSRSNSRKRLSYMVIREFVMIMLLIVIMRNRLLWIKFDIYCLQFAVKSSTTESNQRPNMAFIHIVPLFILLFAKQGQSSLTYHQDDITTVNSIFSSLNWTINDFDLLFGRGDIYSKPFDLPEPYASMIEVKLQLYNRKGYSDNFQLDMFIYFKQKGSITFQTSIQVINPSTQTEKYWLNCINVRLRRWSLWIILLNNSSNNSWSIRLI